MLVSDLEEHKSAPWILSGPTQAPTIKVTTMENGGISEFVAVPVTSLPVGVATVN